MKRSLALLSFAIVTLSFAAGCQNQATPAATSAPTFTTVSKIEPTFTSLPPTATVTPTPLPPTATPTDTVEPTIPPTETPTLAPTPKLWRIWFKGVKCEDPNQLCGDIREGIVYQYKYYSILSNGDDFQELSISELPLLPTVSPHLLLPDTRGKVFHESPDKSQFVYVIYKELETFLYVADYQNEQPVLLYAPPKDFYISMACWTHENEVRFVVADGTPFSTVQDELYSIEPDASNLRILMALGKLPSSGNCSPNGQEFVFPRAGYESSQNGLYIFDFETGQLRQILSGYAVWDAQPAPIAEQP